jgi:hypothetical protein
MAYKERVGASQILGVAYRYDKESRTTAVTAQLYDKGNGVSCSLPMMSAGMTTSRTGATLRNPPLLKTPNQESLLHIDAASLETDMPDSICAEWNHTPPADTPTTLLSGESLSTI